MEYTSKKIKDGVYQYTFANGLIFNIIRIVDADRGNGVQGKWFFKNAEIDSEGGNDHYKSKKTALEALLEYIPHRTHSDIYGWHYNPYA